MSKSTLMGHKLDSFKDLNGVISISVLCDSAVALLIS